MGKHGIRERKSTDAESCETSQLQDAKTAVQKADYFSKMQTGDD